MNIQRVLRLGVTPEAVDLRAAINPDSLWPGQRRAPLSGGQLFRL